jgi:hypothetical protein|tara:strand:+ start:6435 stop:7364 length:930 start_codon:yes stop_codon:yes gene_type:complete
MNFTKSAFEQALENITPVPEVLTVEVDHSDYKEEIALLEALQNLRENNWENIRNPENFIQITRQYSFGSRNALSTSEENNYYLQAARNPNYSTIDQMVNRFVNCATYLSDADRIRISEAATVIEKVKANIEEFQSQAETKEEKNALQKAFLESPDRMIELGFKEPRLMGYYKNSKELEFSEFTGYELSPLLVGISSKLGWDARVVDLNHAEEIDLENAGVVFAYHVLDRLTNPLETLKMLKNNCQAGTKFHIEVPIEPGNPRLRYSKLFAFEKGDLQQMLIEADFIPISFSNIPCPDGPDIERIMAITK